MGCDFGKNVVCDATKCSGCRACEIACSVEHERKNNKIGRTVGTMDVPVMPRLYVVNISDGISAAIQCKHCEDAPCLNICSKEAIFRENGQVIIDGDKCIGCKDCMLACPYGAINLYECFKDSSILLQSDGVTHKYSATKCDLCAGNPDGPACVRACPNKALRLIDPAKEKDEKNRKAAAALLAAAKE